MSGIQMENNQIIMLDSKIEKLKSDIQKQKEKMNKKKKELQLLESKKNTFLEKRRIQCNEQIVSSVEKKLGKEITPDVIERIIEQIKETD